MSYTYNKQEDTSLINEGEYEVKIEKIEKRTTPTTGRDYLSITFRIRDDIEQEFKNRLVFENVWSEKDDPQFYDRRKINRLLGTQEIEEGQSFEDIDKVIDYLAGCNLIITVKKGYDDYWKEERNSVGWFRKSKNKPQTIETSEFVPLDSDDDLPF